MTLPARTPVDHADESVTRIEHDLLGDLPVPRDAYYGVHTVRALQNFPITGTSLAAHPRLVEALAAVKEAAASANAEVGLLSRERAAAIVTACTEVRSGQLHEAFVVDVLQGGAGTSTNMNANEVIANRALEVLGYDRGRYDVLHPVDHVNLSQSTNDAYPTAVKVGLRWALQELAEELQRLADAFRAKGSEFREVLKMGRTQMQDAVPMTVGQEFTAFAVTLEEDVLRLAETGALLSEVNIGGTAIGTGLNAPAGYAAAACRHLERITGLPISAASDLVEATQDVGSFVHASASLKRVAVKLSKICNDLRLLSSGPRAGLGELNLPAVQAGSSIMPGKVNPVIPEVVNQIAHRVVGNDVTVTMAAEGGQLQLNAFEPVVAHCLFESLSMLTRGSAVLRERCVDGITVNADALRLMVESSVGLATALNPRIGYRAATDIAVAALLSGRGVREVARESGLLTEAELDELLSVRNLARLGDLPAPPTL